MSARPSVVAPRGACALSGAGSQRRRFVQSGLGLALAGCGMGDLVRAELLPPTYRVEDALAAIAVPARASDRVHLRLPERIEDGAAVPVTVTADLADVEALYVLTDMNPMPIAAWFRLGPGMAPRIAVRIKLAGNGRVYGAAKGRDGLHWTATAVEVLAGGCS